VNVGTAINSNPTSTGFTKSITLTDTIDFSSHVFDHETTDANLKIKIQTLPANGMLTTSDGNAAATGTPYAVNDITYPQTL